MLRPTRDDTRLRCTALAKLVDGLHDDGAGADDPGCGAGAAANEDQKVGAEAIAGKAVEPDHAVRHRRPHRCERRPWPR